jgi:hypothetical protein
MSIHKEFLATFGICLFLLSVVPASGQQPTVDWQPIDSSSLSSFSFNSEPPPLPPAGIIAGFIKAEARAREALNQHTFKRDVLLQTIGPNGEVTGQYIRHSQFLFDDKGNRIERVFYHPRSTIWEMKITKEDIQDLAGAQLLGIDIVEITKYQLSFVGSEVKDGRETLVIDVRPRQSPDPYRMRERFFVGRVWIDPTTLQVIRVRGIVEPHGKQRFPVFETSRGKVGSEILFPTQTEADDTLHFPNRDVHYRIKVRYYDYKRFASKVSISEIEVAN